jgi:hypothetical protein
MKQKLDNSVVQQTVEQQKTVNQKDENGNTPLHHAVLNGSTIQYVDNTYEPNFVLIEKLFSLGADPKTKNSQGLHPWALMNIEAWRFINELQYEDPIYAFKDKIRTYRKRYFELMLKYQPTFENILFFFENREIKNDIEHWVFLTVNVQELSQECLRSLVSWCEKGIKIFDEKIKPCTDGTLDKSAVPICFRYAIDDIKTLLSRCQKELLLFEKYNYLDEKAFKEVLKKIVDSSKSKRATILTALCQNQILQGYLDPIIVQLNELPIEQELKQKVRQFNEELQEWLKSSDPQLLDLTDAGKKFTESLFDELDEVFLRPQVDLDMKIATSTPKWTFPKPDDLIKAQYGNVLNQICTFDRNRLKKIKKEEEDTSCSTHSNSSSSSSSISTWTTCKNN